MSAIASTAVIGAAFAIAPQVERGPTESASSSRDPMPRADAPPATVSSPSPVPEPTVVPREGDGTFVAATGDGSRAGRSGRLVEYRVEAEEGLGLDPDEFSTSVEKILADRRGWTADGAYAFRRTPAAALRVVLASPATTDVLCAPLQTRGEVSCRNGNDVVINAKRWVEGADLYADLTAYRQYLINHEVGHALGFGHEACSAPGALAPVMLQQSLRLDGCTTNPWP